MAYYTLKSYKLTLDPFEIFQRLQGGRGCFFLDSSLASGESGRFSFLGIDPVLTISAGAKTAFDGLRNTLDSYRVCIPKCRIPFLGGAVGYLSYDLGESMEKKITRRQKEAIEIPECRFAFYNTAIIIDHLKHNLHVCAVGFPEKSSHWATLLCRSNLKKIHALLSRNSRAAAGKNEGAAGPRPVEIESNFNKTGYLSAVKKAKAYIKKGDIYQVNLSQRFSCASALDPKEIYGRLRRISPSYFSCYLDGGDFQIASSSPERFLKVDGRRVVTRPMKGTRPRSSHARSDRRFKKALLGSAKDKAELLMIVDLERNDLGRVCDYGSIKVTALRELESYSTVYQTTATVEGILHRDKDRFDLLRACFPGGSITGCPKIRAMEIIEELEPCRRAIYTGSLGYLSFTGDMDFNILIRTFLKKQNSLYFGVGAGIVADSEPEAEYRETLVKAKAILQAINVK